MTAQPSSAEPECRFCLANRLLIDAPLFTNRSFYVLGHLDPARQNALMVVTRRHVVTPFDMVSEEWADLPEALNFAKDHLPASPGYTLGWNVGAVAGQHVFHAHLHVISRKAGGPDDSVGIYGALRDQGL